MPPIDDKVVAMNFDNSKFESGVQNTLSTLDKLKAALKFDGAGKGFDDLNKSAEKVDLSPIGKGISDIESKLGYLSVAALSIFANIAQSAAGAAVNMVKSFSLGPVIDGFNEYAINLNAIQTILANTQAAGTDLNDVNKALDELNHYSDLTIYNFSQMAKNIGTFTAAGVDLQTSTASIKGIANLAALSGSNADQASSAMYQLSQALASGQVQLKDWISVVNAGMGGTVFQRALAQTGEAMGTIKKGALELKGPMKNVTISGESFRDSISGTKGKSWLTSGVLTSTLKQFTNDLTDAQVKAMGFNAEQVKAIQQMAKTAMHAATEVKTIKQVLDVAKESLGSGWAETMKIVFGDFGQAKTTFTALSNTIGDMIKKSADARNAVLGDWKKLGGRTVLINSIKTAFTNLGEILKPIKEAFREIFPAKTGKDLIKLTYEFKHFADALKPSAGTVDGLKRTFAGLFALLDIGKQIIGGIFTVFGQLFGSLGKGSGGFLNFTGSIGDFLVKVDEALKKGGRLHNFFVGFGSALSAPIKFIQALVHALSGLFSGFSSGGISDKFSGITKAMTPLQKVMTAVSELFSKMIDNITNSGPKLQPILDSIINFIQGIGVAIGHAVSGMNFEVILDAIRTGLLGGIVVIFRNFMHQITGKNIFGGGILKNISSSFNNLSGVLGSMQNKLRAQTLKEIAIAIALLTVSVVALSFVNPDKLKAAIIAMGFMFAELLGAMKIMDKIGSSKGMIKMPLITASLLALAIAIDILVIAVVALSLLSWEKLLKGLTGVGVLLGIISAASIPLSKNSAGMVRAGIGITAMAIGLNILAIAVKQFSGMSWTEMGKGLVGVAGGLAVMVAGMTLMPPGMITKSVGLLAVAVALKLLASSVKEFGNMDWEATKKGMLGIGGALIVIGAALHLMPKNLIFIALGLMGITAALKGIADVVKTMAIIPVNKMAKGLIGLAAALVILAAALYAMSGSLAGATALAIAASGLSLLAPAIVTLGKMSWKQLLVSMIALASTLAILAVAGALITPMVPSLIGLGAALLLMGAGLALAGAGVALLGIGLAALVVAAPTGIGILIAAIEELLAAVPKLVKGMILGLLEIVNMLAATAPKFVDALIKILNSLLDVIIKSSPKISEAFNALLDSALNILYINEPKIVQAGFDLLLAVLNGIRNNIGQVVTAVVGIITAFINAISKNLGLIIRAGVNLLLSLIKGIASYYASMATAGLTIIAKFLQAIASKIGDVVKAGLNILTKFLQGIASGVGSLIKAGANLIIAFITGIGNAGTRIVTAATKVIITFINALGDNSLKIAQAGAKALLDFINGLTAVINQYAPKLRTAGWKLGLAIVNGMTGGLVNKAEDLYGKVSGIMHHAMGLFHSIPDVKSPSKVTTDIGENIIQGLVDGITKTAPEVFTSAATVSKEILAKFNEVFQVGTGSGPMYEIGKLVSQGFAKGIRGSTDDITSAFSDLNSKLTDSMKTARETIASEQDKLDKLRKEKKPDTKAIAEAQKAILDNQAILEKSTATHDILVNTLRKEGVQLLKLSVQYDDLTTKLDNAKSKLDEAKQAWIDEQKTISDQFSTPGDISGPMTDEIKTARDNIAAEQKKFDDMIKAGTSTPEEIAAQNAQILAATDSLNAIIGGNVLDASGNSIDQLASYMKALENQTSAVGAYSSTLEQLRKLGLDDVTYNRLLTEGTADQSFANQLLAGGRTAVTSLNELDTNLKNVSNTLGINAAKNLKSAGVLAAEGLVKGLIDGRSKIKAQMESIARMMIRSLKKELDAKSPSQEFAAIGQFAMEGLAQGVSASSKIVTNAIEATAQDALTAMQKSMRDISNVVTNELDVNPVITPILDLTQVQSKTQELAVLTKNIPLIASASFGQASIISSQQTAAQAEISTATPVAPSVTFEQNNYSPEALTEVEIYRQTRNQLSQLKSVLAI